MNAAYINPFLTSTINLFDRTFGFAPAPGQAYLDDRATTHRWDISAVMILTGNAIGVVALRMTKLLADKLLDRSGVQWTSPDEREGLVDGMVGEMINIIAGNASAELKDFDIEISVPIVIQGENHSLAWPAGEPIIAIPFATPFGPFVVKVCIFEPPKQRR